MSNSTSMNPAIAFFSRNRSRRFARSRNISGGSRWADNISSAPQIHRPIQAAPPKSSLAFTLGKKLFHHRSCAIVIKIDVATKRETHHALGLICQRKQFFAECDGHDIVALGGKRNSNTGPE